MIPPPSSEDPLLNGNGTEPKCYYSDGDLVNVSEWIANAIADTGCKVVYGRYSHRAGVVWVGLCRSHLTLTSFTLSFVLRRPRRRFGTSRQRRLSAP